MAIDPISLLLTALAAGAAAAAKDTASQAVKDAYAGLKQRLQQHFAGKHQAEVALEGYEQDADTWQKPLQKAVEASGAHNDPTLLAHAQQVLKLVQPRQVAQGKYIIQIGESKGAVIGDHSQVTQNFGKE